MGRIKKRKERKRKERKFYGSVGGFEISGRPKKKERTTNGINEFIYTHVKLSSFNVYQ